jgi:alpha-beta hydrolase superfamily lysophospholipase
VKRARYLLLVPVVALALLAALVAFGTRRPAPPRPGVGIATALDRVDYSDRPPASFVTVRDGSRIAYRHYPGARGKIAVLVHGSSSRSRSMHALARHLAGAGVATVYALDVRGHGESGPRGDVAYVGQLEDDLADVIAWLRAAHPAVPVVVAGFSSGGGFVLRFATSGYGDRADAYVVLAPFLHWRSPTNHPAYGGWVTPYTPRIVGLLILNALGISAFDHLPVLAFNLPEAVAREVTATYSWRLYRNFKPTDDYRHAMARLRQPVVLLIGRNDEDFRAEAYAAELAAAPRLPIVTLEGVNHIGLIVEDRALEAIAGWVRRLPGEAT